MLKQTSLNKDVQRKHAANNVDRSSVRAPSEWPVQTQTLRTAHRTYGHPLKCITVTLH